jgi:transglutaminase superfamily protein
VKLLCRAVSLSANDWWLLAGAWATVARVAVAMWMRPSNRLPGSNGTIRPAHDRAPFDRLEWAVRVASRAVPHATCLAQALALQRLLARNGYASVVQVGACNVDGRFVAHAWVEHEGHSLLGTSEDVARYERFFSWPQTNRS